LRRLGADPQPRRDATGQLFCTDGGNRILDCRFREITDPQSFDRMIGQTVGVVETGLFIGMAEVALIADAAGVRAIRRGG
jgi:ribose 5-phosphate isomerase A